MSTRRLASPLTRAAPTARRRQWLPVLAAAGIAVLAVFVHGFRLSAVEWKNDEVGYRNAGVAYLRGDVELNREHPFLVKYLYGAAQLLVGDGSPTAVRAVSAAAAVLTTVVVALLVARVAGLWPGLLAGLLWVVLPHPVQLGVRSESVAPKLERIASLEAVMVLFLTIALYGTWRWVEQGAWRYAALTGAALGAAGASKAAALFAVPSLVALAGWAAVRHRRGGRAFVHAGGAALLAVGVVVLTYAPDLAGVPGHLSAITDNASAQASGGHAVIVAGELYASAPWWSLLWWQWTGQGSVVTALLLGLSVTAVFRPGLPRPLVALLLLSIAVPLAWFSLANGFVLSHYAAIYQAPLTVLVTLVIVDLLRGGGAARLAGAVAGTCLVVAATVTTVGHVATLAPTGFAALAGAQDLVPAGGRIAVSGNPFTAEAYFPGTSVTAAPDPAQRYDAVVVDRRLELSPAVAVLLDAGGWQVVLSAADVELLVRQPG